MRLHDLSPAPGSTHSKKRIGRGAGTGQGKTAGKGHKGQKSRSGGGVRPGFEGGQTPLYRRLPHLRGFKKSDHIEFTVVNLDDLELFDAGSTVNRETMMAKGLIKKAKHGIKILGGGELTKALDVKADKFSKTALESIKAAGGTASTVDKDENVVEVL